MEKLVFVSLAVLAVAIITVNGADYQYIKCDNDDPCKKWDENARCIKPLEPCDQGICYCKKGYSLSLDYSKCKKNKEVGDSCDSSIDQCIGSSSCTSSKCSCPSSLIEKDRECREDKKELGEKCTSATDCFSNACTSDKCACSSGFEEKDDSCVKTSELEKMTLGKGETCGTASKLCKEDLQCSSCPGSTNNEKKCLKLNFDNGAETLAPLSFITLVVSLLVGKYFF